MGDREQRDGETGGGGGGGIKVDICNVPGKRVRVQKYTADRHTE